MATPHHTTLHLAAAWSLVNHWLPASGARLLKKLVSNLWLVGRLLFIQQFRSRRRNYREELEFFYLVENPQDYMAVDLSTTTHGEAEIAVCEFVNPSQVDILPTFLKTIDLDDYVTNVRSPYLFVEL